MDGRKSPVAVPKKIIKSEYLENNDKTAKTEASLTRVSSSGSSVELVNKTEITTDFGNSPQNEQIPTQEVPEQNTTHVVSEPVKETSFQLQYNMLVNMDESVKENAEGSEMPSHCSVAGTCFSEDLPPRLFVFPKDCPGYEIIPNSATFSSKQILNYFHRST